MGNSISSLQTGSLLLAQERLPERGHDHILNKHETAKMIGISLRSLERHEAEGTSPPRVRLGIRRWGYWHSDVTAWLRARTGPRKAA